MSLPEIRELETLLDRAEMIFLGSRENSMEWQQILHLLRNLLAKVTTQRLRLEIAAGAG